jgi:transposase
MPKRNKSRRVDTYVKPTTIKQSVKFPYQRYRIDWIDIITEGGWGTEREFKNMKLATPVSEGWLFSKDDDTVRIFAGYDVEDDGSIHFSERSVFPTSCVKKMTKLN